MDPQKVTAYQIESWIKTYYDKSGSVRRLAGEADANFIFEETDGASYVFKVAAAVRDASFLNLENEMMFHLISSDLPFMVPQPIANLDNSYISIIALEDVTLLCRLLTWVEGTLFAKYRPHSPLLLANLGVVCGKLSDSLKDFHNDAAQRAFAWSMAEVTWVEDELQLFNSNNRTLIKRGLDQVEKNLLPHLAHLRHSVCYYDANDYNVLVDSKTGKIAGIIDFGDILFAPTVSELAIACTYALMNKSDLLAALVEIVRGYHQIFPLEDIEVKAIAPMITARLLASLTFSTRRVNEEPNNQYLQISAVPGWNLLKQWMALDIELVYHYLRFACGLEPHPDNKAFRSLISKKALQLSPILPEELLEGESTVLDLSIGSTSLGNNQNFSTAPAFEKHISHLLAGSAIGIGRYLEPRPIYTTSRYEVEGLDGPEWRSVHLGIDLFATAGTHVFAPVAGKVRAVRENEGDRNYGPTIILEHESEGLTFFTLYGHLSRSCLQELCEGQEILSGEQIAKIGDRAVNGGWPPHLHFQILLSLYHWDGDFPGVANAKWSEIWQSVSPDPNQLLRIGQETTYPDHVNVAAMLEQRRNSLGKNLSLSYSQPLLIERGFRSYLYESNGRKYLDMVNNVAHVGHEHPKVVEAGQSQMGLLNTNTRYLHHRILELSEKLIATTPPGLDVVYFCNSGSEANELALRMANVVSGGDQWMALEHGYHGNTGACISVSSYKFDGKGGAGCPPHVHILPMPDPFRGLLGQMGTVGLGNLYAKYAADIIAKLNDQGKRLSAFIGESILSCGGQVVPPPGFLSTVYELVRKAGGVCIADEVQTGIGRIGKAYWAFEAMGAKPDIMVIGKPFGNGHPIGAVVTTNAIADGFDNGMEYFNTFGGNPVSCAIGLAVLQVVEEEELMQNAQEIGSYLRQGMEELGKEYSMIGDVRGMGLFLGMEFVTQEINPAAEPARYLVNRMRSQGILLSTDGPDHNVIKIKPPMVFSKSNADFFLDRFRKTLKEDFLKQW